MKGDKFLESTNQSDCILLLGRLLCCRCLRTLVWMCLPLGMFCENTVVTGQCLIAVHSCSRRGVAAARLTSEHPGGVIPFFKNIDCVPSTFVASVTVGVSETEDAWRCMRSWALPNNVIISIKIVSGGASSHRLIRHFQASKLRGVCAVLTAKFVDSCWAANFVKVSVST